VHPAKHEVRFRNSRDIHALLSQSVSQAMFDHQKSMKTTLFGIGERFDKTAIPLDSEPEESYFFESSIENLQPNDLHHAENEKSLEQKNIQISSPAAKRQIDSSVAPLSTENQPLFTTAEPIKQSTFEERELPEQQRLSEQFPQTARHNLLIVGQYDDLYIFCKNKDGLLVIDQHAAHERLLYEKLLKQYHAKTVVRQTLMFPETVELSLFQSQLVEKNEQEIDRIGFSVREFGGNTYIISAVPALAGRANPRELFLDILEQFGSENEKRDTGGFLNTLLATMACKAAVKAGTELSNIEIDNLLNEMTKADLFSHCPHGRPVVKQFTRDEVKKWFYRT
jgi:DNA mismatch repair protein MutL